MKMCVLLHHVVIIFVCVRGHSNFSKHFQDFIISIARDGASISENERQPDCRCLPSCTSLTYKVMTIKNKELGGKETFQDDKNRSLTEGEIFIMIDDIRFVAKQRTELFGQTDFFANCGGLLGLFMGFSVLSLVELVYFCTISLYNRLIKKKNM